MSGGGEIVTIKLEVWRDYQGAIQVVICNEEDGGYRILGPSFIGRSTKLTAHALTKRDADEIRRYLDKVSP